MHAFEAFVHGSRELSEFALGRRVVLRHRSLVHDVRHHDHREHDDRDDTEGDVGDEQPDGRDDDHQDGARGERDRCDHAHRRLGVDTRSGDEVAIGMAAVPCDGLTDELVEHLIRIRLGHHPHPGRGSGSAEDDADRPHDADPDDQREPGRDRATGDIALFEPDQYDVVDHPADREARRHRPDREKRCAEECERERARMQLQHRRDEEPVPLQTGQADGVVLVTLRHPGVSSSAPPT